VAKPKHQILIVDDEEDIHAVTTLGLRGLKFQGKRCEFLSAHSGKEAVQMARDNPNIAVILLDVVMESDHAGLDACRSIRTELGNNFVRIILRTGQPGSCPEKETIDDYDIDGYLAKTEITATKLYSSVRTALKAWHELMELERHKRSLALINECAMAVHSYEPMEVALNKILSAAANICMAESAVLSLETFDQSEVASHYLMHQTSIEDKEELKNYLNQISTEVNGLVSFDKTATILDSDKGVVFPFALHHELGHGWIYLETRDLDDLQQQAMSLLSGHAANALYSTVAQGLLTARGDDDDDFDLMAI
jgi:CheY-like chemotaxis protein